MDSKRVAASASRSGLLLCVAVLALGAGCATDKEIHSAINDVNDAFRERYEKILKDKGTRRFAAGRDSAFVAMHRTLAALEMRVENEDRELGYLSEYAPAPKPLSDAEWRQAVEADLPLMRQLASKHVGMLAGFLNFEPDAFEILIHVTIVDAAPGSRVSLTMRMREVKRHRPSNIPAREYAPPTAVILGLDKIWARFERELQSTQGRL